MITSMQVLLPVKFGVGNWGGEGGGEGDLKNCAYLWKNRGYAPGHSHSRANFQCLMLTVCQPSFVGNVV